ncbi:hypothetical protein [Roseburia sp. 1XD42-69]|nr:hypothetical protein [Roseburia sp. 1XD42-69]
MAAWVKLMLYFTMGKAVRRNPKGAAGHFTRCPLFIIGGSRHGKAV